MNHLFNISVYHPAEELEKAEAICSDGKYVDGLEILTGYSPADPSHRRYAASVHLPYAVDWYSPAIGRLEPDASMDADSVRFLHYGRNREDIVDALYGAIKAAEPLEPAYGVLHAGCGNMDELLCYDYSDRNADVLEVFCGIVNEVVSRFPDGEPPFTLAFENTWWPGLKLADSSGYEILEDRLQFFDWGLCLDTGHLLCAMKGAEDEAGALEILNRCADSYSEGLLARLVAMHLHVNTSAKIIRGIKDLDIASIPKSQHIQMAYKQVCSIDQHRPFTDPAVKEYVERLDPDYVVHEMGAPGIIDHIRDHICQRSLFD